MKALVVMVVLVVGMAVVLMVGIGAMFTMCMYGERVGSSG